jgi:hypothetical protein
MRKIWLGAVVASLGLGAAGAWADEPAATLGRPVPAASLGRPVAMSSLNQNNNGVSPAGFLNAAPSSPAATIGQEPAMPILAPVSTPGNLTLGDASKPMPTPDATPQPLPLGGGSGAVPAPAAPSYGPTLGPTSGPAPAPCNTCGGGIAGPMYSGDPVIGPAHTMLNAWAPLGGRFQSRVYASAEYLLWFSRNDHAPALAITTPIPATSVNPNPQPQTVLFGDGASGLFPTLRHGARVGLGLWFSPEHIRAVEFNFMFLGTAGTNYSVDSSTTPEILRPFFNTNVNTPFVQIVAQPGVSTGNLAIHTDSSLYGLDLNYRRRVWGVCDPCGLHIDFLTGFRYQHLNENLDITENFTALPAALRNPGVQAASGTVTDHFGTRNNFYGWQLGLQAERHWGRWSVDATAKVALGVTESQSNVFGAQNLVINGVPVTASGGLLALNSNSGVHSGNAFSVLPEVGINLGYQITPRLKAFVGYSFMYWSNVIRPGEQIDTNVDAARIPNFLNPPVAPTTGSPQPRFVRTDYWAQGINFGLQYKW